MLAGVPAVLAQDGGGGARQDTVKVCHFADGKYEVAFGLETDSRARNSETTARTRRTSFRRSGSRTRGRTTRPPSRAGTGTSGARRSTTPAARRPRPPGARPARKPRKKVRICHATSSNSNPYTSPEPAIANNGDLNGGHLNHTGPVYPGKDWGDIIPPYNYVDQKGQPQTFPGYNWSPEGQAIWQNNCEPPHPPDPPAPKPITPILGCVEDQGWASSWPTSGTSNPNATTIEPPASENKILAAAEESRAADRIRRGSWSRTPSRPSGPEAP